MRGQQTEADRIAELRDDPQCRQFDAHRCLCAACGRWVHLSGRAHKIFNWRRHKKGCTPQKARGAITIIHNGSPTMDSYDVDELDNGMDEDHYSSYSYSDEGHGGYQHDERDERLRYSRHDSRLPSISTFSLPTSSEAATPPLSSSASTASESGHSMTMYPHYSHRTASVPRKSNHPYDPVLASRVQCDGCSMQIDLPEWTAHKRLCRTQRAQSAHNTYNSPPSLPSRLHTTDLSPTFSTLPPLSAMSLAGSSSSISDAKPHLSLAPILTSSRSQPQERWRQPPYSAEPQQRPTAPRKIADLCNPSSTSVPDYMVSPPHREVKCKSASQSSTPTHYSNNNRHHSASNLRDYAWKKRSFSPTRAVRSSASPSPSPPPSYGYGAHGRSLSPPSPFASDSES